MADRNQSAWLLRPPREDAIVRLFCLPYAGAGASAFGAWRAIAPPGCDVCAIQLPGRESRLAEPAARRVEQLVPMIVEALPDIATRPYALFGHSMGALIAYELELQLEAAGHPPADALFVSGAQPPHDRGSHPPLSSLNRSELIPTLVAMEGLPQYVVEDDELRELVIPTIEADLELADAYRGPREPTPVRSALYAFGGVDDARVEPSALEGWASYTEAEFAVETFPGGHFYLRDVPDRVVRAIATRLRLD